MKIEWANEDCTEAYVTRGLLWWKRRAHVKYDGNRLGWFYASGNQVTTYSAIWHSLVSSQSECLARRREQQDWQPISVLPPARVVKS